MRGHNSLLDFITALASLMPSHHQSISSTLAFHLHLDKVRVGWMLSKPRGQYLRLLILRSNYYLNFLASVETININLTYVFCCFWNLRTPSNIHPVLSVAYSTFAGLWRNCNSLLISVDDFHSVRSGPLLAPVCLPQREALKQERTKESSGSR